MAAGLMQKYTEVHKQGFMPILVNDGLDAVAIAEVCVNEGCKAIEITCRRPRVMEEIHEIRSKFPDLIIMVGSVVDDSVLLPYLRSRRDHFPSIEQLSRAGIDGYVSQLPISNQTLAAYSDRFLMIPGVETLSEAVDALNAGAHFVKFCSMIPDDMRRINNQASYHLFPVFYTGGASAELIPQYIRNGAVLVGSGWDLILPRSQSASKSEFDPREASRRLRSFNNSLHAARAELISGYEQLLQSGADVYLQSLHHYHPFA